MWFARKTVTLRTTLVDTWLSPADTGQQGTLKNPHTHPKRVGHEVPGVLVFARCTIVLLKCSETLVLLELLYNPRVNEVFTSLHFTLKSDTGLDMNLPSLFILVGNFA